MPADLRNQPPAPFRVEVHPERDVIRVVPVGELDVATAGALERQLHELCDAGFEHVVLDLRDLTFIDSSGIRVLVSEHRLATTCGHELSIVGASAVVRRALEVCGLLEQLRMQQT